MLERETVYPEPDHRLITEQVIRDIYDRVKRFQSGDGEAAIRVTAWWRGCFRWARNRVVLASDQRDITLGIGRRHEYGRGEVYINQIDDASLKSAVSAAERKMRILLGRKEDFDGVMVVPPMLPFPDTPVWSDATFNVTPETRAQLTQVLVEEAESQQLLAAGFMQMRVYETQRFGFSLIGDSLDGERERIEVDEPPVGSGETRTARVVGYRRHCEAECSMTVRHPKGIGSGWAGVSGYDWSVLDPKTAAHRSITKCLASLNPVAIEPGRYTVILEPQATAFFATALVRSFSRSMNEVTRAPGVWSLDVDPSLNMRMTKLGLKIIDERISISHEPMDPRLGTVPTLGLGNISFVEDGVLKTLGYPRSSYSLPNLQEELPQLARDSFRMSGGTTSMEEMISTTKRGLIVTRFSTPTMVTGSGLSLLWTGLTRDGLWLVENGKISKAVKNMRFTESPLFVFNQIEQLGAPVPVFGPGQTHLSPKIVPSIKAKDFAFTATIDAI